MTIFGRKAQPSVVLVQRHYVNTIAVASKFDSYNLWVHSVMAAEGFSVGPVHGKAPERRNRHASSIWGIGVSPDWLVWLWKPSPSWDAQFLLGIS